MWNWGEHKVPDLNGLNTHGTELWGIHRHTVQDINGVNTQYKTELWGTHSSRYKWVEHTVQDRIMESVWERSLRDNCELLKVQI